MTAAFASGNAGFATLQADVAEILNTLAGATNEDDMTPEEEVAEAVQNRLRRIERNPDKDPPPEVDPDDPHGWSPDVQSCRRLMVRQRADHTGQCNRPGDRDPIPAWPHLPPISQCGAVIAHLRDLAAEAPEPEPVEEDVEDLPA